MSKQARVGLFSLIGLVAVFAVFYVLSDLGARSRGYKVGVRFPSAAGLRRAATVSLSGVPIGVVDHVVLEPDYSTDVILAISPGYGIPVGSRYLIQAPLTGEPSILIEPPRNGAAAEPTLPPEVLPLAEQPQGASPLSIGQLLEEGQGEVKRFDKILAQLEEHTPALLSELDATLKSASALGTTANASLGQFSAHANAMIDSLQITANRAGQNVTDLTATLDTTVKNNSGKIDSLLTQLNKTSVSFAQSVDALRDVATNPQLKANMLDTVRSFALTARTLAELTGDLRQVTGNPQTQAQLRDTVARIDATSQKIDSILGSFGGTSDVYGVDKNATPAPGGITPLPAGFVPTSKPAIPSLSQPIVPSSAPVPIPLPAGTAAAAPRSNPNQLAANLKKKIDNFTKDLVELQVRVTDLAPERPGSADRNTSPLLTSDRGPQSDFNLSILPRGQTSLFVGANDIGYNSTANVMLLSHRGPLTYGAGVEYSRLGLRAALAGQHVGFEIRAYDLRHPTLDAYTNLFLAPKLQLFGGERDTTHASRRTVFGLQFEP